LGKWHLSMPASKENGGRNLKRPQELGNKVRIDGDKFHVEIKSKSGDKGKSNEVINDLLAGQTTVTLGVTASYVE
jgi:hypothetical protein